jgi:F-box/WD-40 domain protein MET30
MTPDPHTALLQGHDHEGTKARHPLGTKHDGLDVEQKDAAIFPLQVEHTSERMITPFLTQHVPQQYNPQPLNSGNANTKYCYRHRPDLKCRRQADEPSMEELQSVRLFALSPSMSYC